MSDDKERLGRLLRAAGPRPRVPEERMARARAEAREAWRETVAAQGGRARSARRVRLALAAAALLAAVLLAVTWSRREAAVEPLVASGPAEVLRVEGGVSLRDASGAERLVVPGQRITSPSVRIVAADGRIALRLASGHEVRLDSDTVLALPAADSLRLERGAIYIDSDGADESRELSVETPLGVVTETGTQYEVRLDTDGVLRVRVREGSVRIAAGNGSRIDVDAGREHSLRKDGAADGRALATDDPLWSWTRTVEAPFVLEGRSLSEFLGWARRERGARFRFADGAAEAAAGTITLRGDSIQTFDTSDALTIVLTSCGWTWTRDGDGVYLLEPGS